jgi:hypothetical protein
MVEKNGDDEAYTSQYFFPFILMKRSGLVDYPDVIKFVSQVENIHLWSPHLISVDKVDSFDDVSIVHKVIHVTKLDTEANLIMA